MKQYLELLDKILAEGFATIVFSTFFLLYLYMLFLILIFNGCFFECPAVKMLDVYKRQL